MTVQLSMLGGAAAQFLDNNGAVLSGGKLYTYAAGTTTLIATFTNSTGVTNHTNPIILDSAGRIPGGEIWLTDGVGYKFVVKTSADVTIATYDNIEGNGSGIYTSVLAKLAENDGSSLVGYQPLGTDAVDTNVQTKLRETVSVKDFGAVGDGVTDDTAAIQAAYNATSVGGTLVFPEAKNYLLNSKLVFNKSVNIDFGGSTLISNSSIYPDNRAFDLRPDLATTVTWTEVIGLGTYTFNVSNSLSIGDYIVLRLGVDPYDAAEDHYVRVCRVISSSSTAFTVDVRVPYTINGTSHRFEKITGLVSNVTIKNLVIDYVTGTTPDTNINAYNVFNVRFENIRSNKARILLNVYESHNVYIGNVDATVVRNGVSSHGRVFTGWQLENTLLENISCYGTDNEQMLFLENWCRGVKIVNLQLNSSNTSQSSSMLHVSGGSYDIDFDGVIFSPAAAVDVVNTGGTFSDYRFKQLRLLNRPQYLDMKTVESFADPIKNISFMGPLGVVQNKAEGTLTTGVPGHRYVNIANGVLRRLWVYVESTTDLTAYVANNVGGIIPITSELVANEWKEITAGYKYGTLFGVNDPSYPTKTVQLFPGAGFPASAAFAVVAEYWPIDASPYTFRVTTTY